MSSIVKNPSVSFLDVREKPEWELLDLREETGDFEHEFFSSVASEFNDIAGFDIDVYLMDPKEIDHIYGESERKGYDGPYRTKMLYSVDNSEQMILDTFGFSADFKVEYAEIPKATWQRDIIGNLDKNFDIEYPLEDRKPMPGDLIKTLWDGYLYKITHASTDLRVFSGKKLVWSLKLAPYIYSTESSDAQGIVYEELDLNDFPEVNSSREQITPAEHRKEAELVKEESHKNGEYDDVDTSVFGY